ncbi:hypothetical protein LR48_Vigan07g086400 [Vigna angularis]|uniref:Uncharacterized protein n=1 Tax=Phaseolus angularis TaxID=3914 RepID=A0A0L9UWC3_PHAAN|nr:hypothetical protein LR48_Vigan07g086400 [Vigna angularis]
MGYITKGARGFFYSHQAIPLYKFPPMWDFIPHNMNLLQTHTTLAHRCQQGVDEGGEERVDSALVGRTRRVLGLGATAEDEGVDDGGRGGCKNGEDEEEKETMHGWVWHGACVEAKRGVVFWGECCYCYGEGCFRENLRKEVTKLMQEEAIYGCGKKSK